MKKFLCLIIAVTMLFSFAACGNKTNSKTTTTAAATGDLKPDIVLKESTYVTYINDVYTNADKYIGKIIQLDGMFTYEDYASQGGKKYYYVYRQGPGCCGNDGSMCGFEFTAANAADYPKYTPKATDKFNDHPWIKVTGKLKQYYEGDKGPYYTLSDSKVEIMPNSARGSAVVSL
jgi:uncharacterized membrane protein YcgQ (UPF0703/DUF1980 family)